MKLSLILLLLVTTVVARNFDRDRANRGDSSKKDVHPFKRKGIKNNGRFSDNFETKKGGMKRKKLPPGLSANFKKNKHGTIHERIVDNIDTSTFDPTPLRTFLTEVTSPTNSAEIVNTTEAITAAVNTTEAITAAVNTAEAIPIHTTEAITAAAAVALKESTTLMPKEPATSMPQEPNPLMTFEQPTLVPQEPTTLTTGDQFFAVLNAENNKENNSHFVDIDNNSALKNLFNFFEKNQGLFVNDTAEDLRIETDESETSTIAYNEEWFTTQISLDDGDAIERNTTGEAEVRVPEIFRKG